MMLNSQQIQILLVSSEWLPRSEALLTVYGQNQLLLGSVLQVQMLLLPIDDYPGLSVNRMLKVLLMFRSHSLQK